VGQTFGASWGDLNEDGMPDLWVGNHAAGPPSLYLNNGDGTFTDVGAENWSGLLGDPHGAAWGDFDGDGDQDLYETHGGCCRSRLYVNNAGLFSEEAIAYGVDYLAGRGRTPTWSDVDRDGRLDLIVANALKATALSTIFRQTAAGPFENVGIQWGITAGERSSVQLSDQDGDDQLDLIFNGVQGPVKVYSPSGDPLVDITASHPIPNTSGVRDIAVGDFDGDLVGDFFYARTASAFDLVQTGPSSINAQLVTNNEEQAFTFQTTGTLTVDLGPSWRETPDRIFIGATGIHPADLMFDVDPTDPETWGIMPHTPGGVNGTFIGYDEPTQTWTVALSSITSGNIYLRILSPPAEPITNLDIEWVNTYVPTLGMYRILHAPAGGYLTAFLPQYPSACVSATTADYDNDMDLDVFMACTGAAANLPNMLFENDGVGGFTAVPNAGGAGGTALGRSDAVVSADYDGDGWVDLFVANGLGPLPLADGPHQLFRNQGGSNNWIQIDLEGTLSNRDGIGARIILEAGGVMQLREQGGGIHTHSQDFQRIHFGMGANSVADRITIHWPSGIEQTLVDVASNQILHVVEGPLAVPISTRTDIVLLMMLAASGLAVLIRTRNTSRTRSSLESP
jgi:hypothetical protein